MNLYVWHGVLRDYTSGMIVAIASSVDEARETVVKDFLKCLSAKYTKKQKLQYTAYLAEQEAFIRGEISKKPNIYRKPAAEWLYGGG